MQGAALMINYNIDTEQGLINCEMSGRITLPEFQQYVQKLMNDPDYQQTLNTLVHFDEGTELIYSENAMAVKQFFDEYVKYRQGACWAFVAPNQTLLSLTQFILNDIDTSSINVEYFLNIDEARHWLHVH